MPIDSAYAAYQRELRTALLRALRARGAHPVNRDVFVSLVPLWTMINGFVDDAIALNPTKELLLSYLVGQGAKDAFVKVAADHEVERVFAKELSAATRATAFTSYFSELVSDSLLLINAVHLFNYRAAAIALRCMLEDLYRHLYYKDNREHFLQVHEEGRSEHDVGITPKLLRTYLEAATYLQSLKGGLQWSLTVGPASAQGLHKLNNLLYARTSAFVHGASTVTLNQFSSNLDFVFNASKAAEVLEMVKRFVLLAVVFLAHAHADLFARFNDSSKRLVLDAFSPAQRVEFRTALNV
jgi:hypothetical protein